MQQITKSLLEKAVYRLNIAAETPLTPYTKGADGKHHANAGNYHLEWAYGGVALAQMVPGGGCSRPIDMGFETKRTAFEIIHAYTNGLDAGKGLK